jgi:predicted kinase
VPRPDLDPALIVLIGVAGAGKSTLAAQWRPSQVLSLDAYRGIVSDDENDQEATADAVMVLHAVLDARLRRNLVTVVDATNVSPDARRRVPADVVEEQHRQLRESIPHLCEEGFAKVIIYSQHRDDERPYPVQF